MEVKKTGEFKGRLDVEGITSRSSDFVHVNFLSILIPPRGVGRAGVAVAVYGPLVFFFLQNSHLPMQVFAGQCVARRGGTSARFPEGQAPTLPMGIHRINCINGGLMRGFI